MNESLQQSIVYAKQLFPEELRSVEKEAPQSLRVRKLGSPVRYCKVPLQRRNDAVSMRSNPSTGVDQGKHHLSKGVAATTPRVNNMASQNIAELQQLKKFVKKVDAAKMRQARMITGDLKVSRRSSHSEPYLTKSEVRLRVANMLEVQINRGSGALSEPKNAPDPGIRARLLVGPQMGQDRIGL